MLRTWLVFVGLTFLWIVTRSVYFETWNSGHSTQSLQPTTVDDCSICNSLLEIDGISIHQKIERETRSVKSGMQKQFEVPGGETTTLAARMQACAQICANVSSSAKLKRWHQP